MRYAIWFVRLVFVAWMFPAGVNHFIPLFDQPLGNQPLSRELFAALADSRLFDLVKGVELVAGVCVLFGVWVPLGLLLCMPISVCVWYWDVPLQGWGSISAYYGWAVLITNSLLCLAYFESYRAMFSLCFRVLTRQRLALGARLVFGAAMLASGIAHFLVPLWTLPGGDAPLAVQLMSALRHSGLLDVAIAVQAVTGALILAGLFVPVALTIVMPVSVCAAYWAVILEGDPLWSALALAAVALNGLLMLACLDAYRPMLARDALAFGERAEGEARYEALFVRPGGRTGRASYAAALVPLLGAMLLYQLLVWGPTGRWCLITLMLPAAVLHVRRLHDMGRSASWLILPAVPIAVAFWLRLTNPKAELAGTMASIALAAAAVAILWGLAGRGQGEPRRAGGAGDLTPA